MEDILVAVIFIAIAMLSSVSKKKKSNAAIQSFENARKSRKEAAMNQDAKLRVEEMKQSAPAAQTKPVVAAKPAQAAAPKTPAPAKKEDHRHEGRQDVPCPKDEPRPSQRRENKPAVPEIPGLKLTFDKNSIVQGFVMSEILNRPRPGMRR